MTKINFEDIKVGDMVTFTSPFGNVCEQKVLEKLTQTVLLSSYYSKDSLEDTGGWYTISQLEEKNCTLKQVEWVPNGKEDFCYVTATGRVDYAFWNLCDDEMKKYLLKTKNYYKTTEEAQKTLDEIMSK